MAPKPVKKTPTVADEIAGPAPISSCNVLLDQFNLSSVYGLGAFHIERPEPTERALFQCEWRVNAKEAGAARQVVSYEGACGDHGFRLRKRVQASHANETPYTALAGLGGRAWLRPQVDGVDAVDLLFESAARTDCWIRVTAPGAVVTAVDLGRAVERGLAALDER